MREDVTREVARVRAHAAGALAPELLRPRETDAPRTILYAGSKYRLYHDGIVARVTHRRAVLVLDQGLVQRLTAGLTPAARPAPDEATSEGTSDATSVPTGVQQ